VKRIVPLGAIATVATAGTFLAIAGGTVAASPTRAPSTLPTISIALTGTTITVGGALQSGAVNIQMTTTNERSAEATLVMLNPGVTVEQAIAYAATPAAEDLNNVTRHIGPVVFETSAPRGTSNAETTLQPGNYLALDTAGNNPAKFPLAAFTVAATAAPAALPAATTVRAIEFGFVAPRTLHRGQVVRFQNAGFVAHMIVGLRARNLTGARLLQKALRTGNGKAVSRLAAGFTGFQGPVSPGGTQQQTVTAAPGFYVLACFLDTQDKREHVRLGMTRVIRVLR